MPDYLVATPDGRVVLYCTDRGRRAVEGEGYVIVGEVGEPLARPPEPTTRGDRRPYLNLKAGRPGGRRCNRRGRPNSDASPTRPGACRGRMG